jgi:D-arabinose 1-dehydrogenase-like Zn-dependent alcohol dehydrogenase
MRSVQVSKPKGALEVVGRMRSVQVSKPKGALEVVDRNIPEPSVTQVRIKVQACGICHSDSFTIDGLFPGIQ